MPISRYCTRAIHPCAYPVACPCATIPPGPFDRVALQTPTCIKIAYVRLHPRVAVFLTYICTFVSLFHPVVAPALAHPTPITTT